MSGVGGAPVGARRPGARALAARLVRSCRRCPAFAKVRRSQPPSNRKRGHHEDHPGRVREPRRRAADARAGAWPARRTARGPADRAPGFRGAGVRARPRGARARPRVQEQPRDARREPQVLRTLHQAGDPGRDPRSAGSRPRQRPGDRDGPGVRRAQRGRAPRRALPARSLRAPRDPGHGPGPARAAGRRLDRAHGCRTSGFAARSTESDRRSACRRCAMSSRTGRASG